MILVLFDIHLNILSAQCTVNYSTSKYNSNIEVSMEKDKICLIVYSDSNLYHQLSIDLPHNLFDPRTISSVCCQDSTNYTIKTEHNFVKWSSHLSEVDKNTSEKMFKLNFRIQISDANVIENCILKERPLTKFINFMKSVVESYQNYNIFCTSCSALLSSTEISFQFVHENHEGMSELSETWFCHKHDDDCQQIFHKHDDHQHSDTLYIGDVYFYMNVSVINNLLLSENEKEYRCIECSSVLSLKRTTNEPSYIGFFSDKVMFQKPGNESRDIKKYKNDVALFSFCNMFEDTLKSAVSCKMYLQSKVGEDTDCLLLWTNSQKVAQFLLYEADNEKIPSKEAFKVKEVYKILYHIPTADSEVAKKWKHDFNVEFFQISDDMMTVVRNMLRDSSKFSMDKEAINGFLFGYLPAYTYDVKEL